MMLAIVFAALYSFLPSASADDASKASQAQLPSQSEKAEAMALYQRAWFLIKTSYYDKTYNGQNWYRWQHRFDSQLETVEDAHRAIATMLESLNDTDTRMIHIASSDSMANENDCGIGVQIKRHIDNRILIISTVPGSPADKAGLQPGDELVSVDSQSVAGHTLHYTIDHLRGEPSSEVSISLQRAGRLVHKTIKRAPLAHKDVPTVEVLPHNIGYIRLFALQAPDVAHDLQEALKQLESTSALIIDLRHNPGGSFRNFVHVAELFAREGTIGSSVDPDGYVHPVEGAGRPLYTRGIVALVNRGTAKSAESLAAALRENAGATLVGERTAGATTIQIPFRLDQETLIIFSGGRMFSPNGMSYLKKGIEPDVHVSLSDEDLAAGKGPWWCGAGRVSSPGSPELKDVQLLSAIETSTR